MMSAPTCCVATTMTGAQTPGGMCRNRVRASEAPTARAAEAGTGEQLFCLGHIERRWLGPELLRVTRRARRDRAANDGAALGARSRRGPARHAVRWALPWPRSKT